MCLYLRRSHTPHFARAHANTTCDAQQEPLTAYTKIYSCSCHTLHFVRVTRSCSTTTVSLCVTLNSDFFFSYLFLLSSISGSTEVAFSKRLKRQNKTRHSHVAWFFLSFALVFALFSLTERLFLFDLFRLPFIKKEIYTNIYFRLLIDTVRSTECGFLSHSRILSLAHSDRMMARTKAAKHIEFIFDFFSNEVTMTWRAPAESTHTENSHSLLLHLCASQRTVSRMRNISFMDSDLAHFQIVVYDCAIAPASGQCLSTRNQLNVFIFIFLVSRGQYRNATRMDIDPECFASDDCSIDSGRFTAYGDHYKASISNDCIADKKSNYSVRPNDLVSAKSSHSATTSWTRYL